LTFFTVSVEHFLPDFPYHVIHRMKVWSVGRLQVWCDDEYCVTAAKLRVTTFSGKPGKFREY